MKKSPIPIRFNSNIWTNVLIKLNLPHLVAKIVCNDAISLTQMIDELNELLESNFKITHNMLLNIRNELYMSRPGPYTMGLKDNKFFIKPNSTPEAMIWVLQNDSV